jgi:delta 1-pyrroline-5-carboxylate dehydrogenase
MIKVTIYLSFFPIQHHTAESKHNVWNSSGVANPGHSLLKQLYSQQRRNMQAAHLANWAQVQKIDSATLRLQQVNQLQASPTVFSEQDVTDSKEIGRCAIRHVVGHKLQKHLL